MSRKRRQHSPEFKAKVALEVLSGQKTLTELAERYDISPSAITKWKSKLIEQSSSLFSKGGSSIDQADSQVEKLYAKIGKLEMERDFLSKAFEPYRSR
jgi:transposase-like protein